MSEQVLKADRRLQIWVFLVAVLISAVSIRTVFELGQSLKRIRGVAQVNPTVAAEQTLALTDSFLAGVAWAFGAIALYLMIQGVRILRADQYPLPGSRVVLDTKVTHGRPARLRAIAGLVLAVLLIVGAFWLPGIGKRHIRSAIVLPSEADARPPVAIDPDAFPSPVPGRALMDPKAPEHPSNPESDTGKTE